MVVNHHPMVDDQTLATISLVAVSLSLPLYLHGVWVILQSERVTWSVLMRHLSSVVPAVLLTLGPVLFWMVPRIADWGVSGLIGVHIFLALQAYALLLIGLWGIVPMFRAKRRHNLYREPQPDIELAELDERMPQWRRRLRLGVFGHLLMWILAYTTGVVHFVRVYVII